MKPEILVLDEPSSNLDPASRRELADILRSLDITMIIVGFHRRNNNIDAVIHHRSL